MGQKRGQLTDRIQDKARELMGREITVTELRLMSYIEYIMLDNQRIAPGKCNQADREVLALWRKEGRIEGGAERLSITKGFWGIICEILFLGYVDVDFREPSTTRKKEKS